jgi:hypothetical protein
MRIETHQQYTWVYQKKHSAGKWNTKPTSWFIVDYPKNILEPPFRPNPCLHVPIAAVKTMETFLGFQIDTTPYL